LLTLLEGADNSSLTIWILPGDFDTGSHNRAYKHQLFIPENSLRLNDGGIQAAVYAFGEFQHDALARIFHTIFDGSEAADDFEVLDHVRG
jgi:hypothetical protein